MREIKFRYVYQCKRTGEFTKRELPLGHIESGYSDKAIYKKCADGGWFSPELIAKVQFIGLKDKNGKEIYEGDIISGFQGSQIPYEVKYGEDASFYGETAPYNGIPGAGTQTVCLLNASVWAEVIGNIHDNPSLLK